MILLYVLHQVDYTTTAAAATTTTAITTTATTTTTTTTTTTVRAFTHLEVYKTHILCI